VTVLGKEMIDIFMLNMWYADLMAMGCLASGVQAVIKKVTMDWLAVLPELLNGRCRRQIFRWRGKGSRLTTFAAPSLIRNKTATESP
jgi:hypothetical protein